MLSISPNQSRQDRSGKNQFVRNRSLKQQVWLNGNWRHAGPPSFEGAAEVERTALELPAETPEEFEIVLGRRQIASVLFVATVILALFSAVSYLAGKSISPKKITAGDGGSSR